MRVFNEFTAIVPEDFYEKLIEYYMEDEDSSREVIEESYGESFKALSDEIAGDVSTFMPDLGYADSSLEGTYCFEVTDNDVCIPVELLEDIREIDERFL